MRYATMRTRIMRKSSQMHPPASARIHLPNPTIINENNAVSTASTSTPSIGWEGGKIGFGEAKIQTVGKGATIENEVDTADTPGSAPSSVKGWIARNDERRENHQGAALADAQVDAIRHAYEAGVRGTGPKIGYRALAQQYGAGKRTIREIVKYKRRIRS